MSPDSILPRNPKFDLEGRVYRFHPAKGLTISEASAAGRGKGINMTRQSPKIHHLTKKPRHYAPKMKDEMRAEHRVYLNSSWWRARSQQHRDERTHCELCGRPKSREMDVHHIHYATKGCEKDTDLRLCCRDCHEAVHIWSRATGRSIKDSTADIENQINQWGRKIVSPRGLRRHARKEMERLNAA